MRRTAIFFIGVFLLLGLLLVEGAQDRIVTVPAASQIYVGTNVRLSWDPVNPGDNYSYNWQLQGGGPLPGNTAAINYTFKDPGNYTVRCTRSDSTSVDINILVRDNRSIELPPKFIDIFEGAEFVLETRNFNTYSLKWNLGDGTVTKGGHRFTHVYRKPGKYTIKVYDFDGQSKVPVKKQLRVERDNREIRVKQPVIMANAEAEVEAIYFRGRSIQWDFGDGTVESAGQVARHTYRRGGSFRIKAIDFDGRDGKTIEKTVQVIEDSRIVTLPDEIIAGEPIDMQLKNAPGGNFVWKFPDGQQGTGDTIKGKIFGTPGMATVTIEDRSGKYPPLTKQVTVQADLRQLQASAQVVIPGDTVRFNALKFKGPGVKWDFDDGTVRARGSFIEEHTFETVGRYTVKAVDLNGQSPKVFSQQINVQELTPGFRVQLIELTFANGKYYHVVGRKSVPPGYRARIKAGGRGILKGKWILDGLVLGTFEAILREKQTVLLKGSNLVRLPVTDQGLHNLTFTFTNYTFRGKIPRLRYFVSDSGMIQIKHPLPDTKLPYKKTIILKWFFNQKGGHYEVAVSEIPFQFLTDDQIRWTDVGQQTEYELDLSPYKKGGWLYWVVREVAAGGRIETTSEIASFKIE
jgi:PKD repeat protein